MEALTLNLTPGPQTRKRMKKIFADIDPASVTKLTITGTLTPEGFAYIRSQMGDTLQELDLSGVTASGPTNLNADTSTETCLFDGYTFNAFKCLTSIILPAAYSDENIFLYDCPCLTSLTIHPDNPLYTSEDGVLYNKDKTALIIFPEGRKGDYQLPASFEYINYDETDFPDLNAITVHPDNLNYSSENGILFNKEKTKLVRYPQGRKGDCFIPASTVEIQNRAFNGCCGITSFTVHPDNPEYTSENGVLFNKEMTELIKYPKGRKGEYIIPDTVETIEPGAFCDCTELTSIVIPDSMTEIEYGFEGCTGLTTVIISQSLTSISNTVFRGCTAFSAITVHPDNPEYSSEDGILFNKEKTRLACYPQGRKGDYVIPRSVEVIGHRAFAYCAGLTSVTIPDTVICIGDYAFYNCTGLTSITIPDSVFEIGSFSFAGCNGLTTLHISKSVVKVTLEYKQIFEEWYPLTFPHSVTVHPDNPIFASEDGVLFDRNKTELIRYPKLRQGDYKIPDSVIKIGKEAFQGCAGLTSVSIPNSVVEIGEEAFRNCSGLTWVYIPDSVIHIDCGAFCNCNLAAIDIPKSVIEITDSAYDRYDFFVKVHPGNPFYTSENGKLTEKKHHKKEAMKVFISGSISTGTLSQDHKAALEQVVEGNRTILIGDAYGVDKAVQKILAAQNYQQVIVYYSGEKPRNNIGNWQTKQIPNPENLTGRSRYQLKDKAMADDCESAIMFWDGKSKGTKANIDYMDDLGKYFLVWLPECLSRYNMERINNMVML